MNRATFVFCAAILLLRATSIVQAEEDWSQWRGARGDGISHHQRVPVKWSATENIGWKVPLSGTGRSSPVIHSGMVFLTEARDSDHSRHVMCIDLSSGDVRWDISVHQAGPGQMHKHNTAASSTPAVDDHHVYAVFVDEEGMQVTAVSKAGRIVWSERPGTFFSQHGFAASPVLYENGVIVNGHQDGSAFVVMLDRMTGQELWRYLPAINLRSFSTPVLTQFEGRDYLILTGASQTAALDPRTGKLIWYADGPAEKFVSTPIVHNGIVYSFGGSPDKKAMAIRLGGQGDVLQSHMVWRNERAMPYVPSPILAGGLLHIVNDLGIYTCLVPETGEVLTAKRALGSVYSSPVAVEERLYFFEDVGKCTVIEVGADFKVLAENDLGEEVYTTPAIAEGCLVVRTTEHLIRIGK